MIMVTYPPALRRTGFGPPRAIRHFTDAIAEARAADAPARQVTAPRLVEPARPPSPPVPARAPRDRVVVRLWLPLTFIFVLLAPFALIITPLFYFAPRRLAPRPFAATFALGATLLAIGGTEVDVDTPDARVHIKIF